MHFWSKKLTFWLFQEEAAKASGQEQAAGQEWTHGLRQGESPGQEHHRGQDQEQHEIHRSDATVF